MFFGQYSFQERSIAMQNHSNESKGAVVPYIAVLLGLLLSGSFLLVTLKAPCPP